MNLNDKLYERAAAEQEGFIEKLKSLPASKIIEAAYEYVMREDILMIFENRNFSDKEAKALLKFNAPIAACYDNWLKADCSHMEMLTDTMKDLASRTAKKYEMER